VDRLVSQPCHHHDVAGGLGHQPANRAPFVFKLPHQQQ
jgi:hypothetical protein